MTTSLRAAFFLALLAASVAGPASAQETEYDQKRAALAPGDLEGLYSLGVWCMGRGGSLDRRGRECFEDLLGSPPQTRDRAAYKLAQWHLSRGRGYADKQLAVEMLAALASSPSEAPAARDLDAQRRAFAERKAEDVRKAQSMLVRGMVSSAARSLAESRRLPFGRATGDFEIDSQAIFEAIARAQADEERGTGIYVDEKALIACPACGASGYEQCSACKGSGKVKGKTPPSVVVNPDGSTKHEPGKVVDMKCGKCGGGGKLPCGACRGTGVDFKVLDDGGKAAFTKFGAWLKNNAQSNDPVKAVTRVFEETIDTRLRVPAALKCTLRFPLIPPVREKMDLTQLKAFWDSASEKDKYDLLRGITVNAARWLEPYMMHSESRKTLGVKEPFRERHLCVPLAAETVSSDPIAFRDRWVRVTGLMESNRVQGPWPSDVVWFRLKGEDGAHSLRTFVWTAASRENHRLLSDLHKDFAYLKTFVWTYQYGIEKSVLAARNGTRVILYGRLIHNPSGFPLIALETWAVDVVKDGSRVMPSPEPAPLPGPDASNAEAGALLHARAIDLLRTPATDPSAVAAAIESLRDSYERFHQALGETPGDIVVQECQARTLRMLHLLLKTRKWPE